MLSFYFTVKKKEVLVSALSMRALMHVGMLVSSWGG